MSGVSRAGSVALALAVFAACTAAVEVTDGGEPADGGSGDAGDVSDAGSDGGKDGGGSAGDAGSDGGVRPHGNITGDWALVWHDEFDGSALDLTKWRPNWFGASSTSITEPVNTLEINCYDPAQVSVSGGTLQLTAVATTQPNCKKKDGSQALYASGLVMSDGRYNFTRGFVEARIWLPPSAAAAPQNWAAFWTNGASWPTDGEIDVMETLSGGPSVKWHYHYDSNTGPGVTSAQVGAPQSTLVSAGGWHVFAAHWETSRITFYYDGVDVGSVQSSQLAGGAQITSSPHYFILNFGLDGTYTAHVPLTMEVDYVRHWQPQP